MDKVFHDLLETTTRDLTFAKQAFACAQSDVLDSDERFERRLLNLEELRDELAAQIATLQKQHDIYARQVDEMLDLRLKGEAGLQEHIERIKTLDTKVKLLTILKLEEEIRNASKD
jgi:hypothetical protein